MNELSAQSSNQLIIHNDCLNNGYDWAQNSNKRSLNTIQYYERKRFCDDSHNSDSYYNDNNCFDDNDEQWQEYTPFDHLLLNITNRLINFNINYVEIPEWPQIFDSNNKDFKPTETKAKIEPKFPPKVGQTFFGWCLDSLVKTEKRYAIFIGHKGDKIDEQFIIKLGIESGFHLLNNECCNLRSLKEGKAVPKLIDFVWWKVYSDNYTKHNWGIVVTEKLGQNLLQFIKRSITLPIELVFDFAVQMIDIIENIHDKGLIHCALKPENFVIESDSNLRLYAIGLSSSRSYLIKKKDGTVEHIEYHKDSKLPKGDPNFHSIGYHNGFRRSRRDDMESIGYCIVYMIKGTLPWIQSSPEESSPTKNIRSIGRRMQATTIEELCQDLPQPFFQYFEIISHLQFEDKPNYEQLRQCFRINK